MKNKYLSTKINSLSLITSLGCNLDCEYCWIAQSKNESSPKLQAENIEALKNGTFLNNVKDVLYKLEQSPYQIEGISLWGQEPTLTLHLLTEHIQDWINLFPNCKSLSFSTNTVAHMDRIIDFLIALDKNVLVNHFEISVQMSYDGEYSTDNLRGVSSSVIHDNVTQFITQLNTIHFNKLHIILNFHGVVSVEMMKNKLINEEEIIKYTDGLQKWGLEFFKLNTNRSVDLMPKVDLALENPIYGSSSDGIRLDRLIEMSRQIPYKEILKENYKEYPDLSTIPKELLNNYLVSFRTIDRIIHEQFGIDNLDIMLSECACHPDLKDNFFRMLNDICFCGNGFSELKIMYDGTLINCQNHIFERDAEFIKDDGSVVSAVKKSLANHKYFVNPLTDSEEDIIRYFYLFNVAKTSMVEFIFKSTLNLMQVLLKAEQIDSSYFYFPKLVKHALILAITNCCSYNNQVTTGSLFLRHSGFIRVSANGFLDKCIDNFNTMKGMVII